MIRHVTKGAEYPSANDNRWNTTNNKSCKWIEVTTARIEMISTVDTSMGIPY
jgi:hypothetical protein